MLLLALVLIAGAVGLVVWTRAQPGRGEGQSSAPRCASSRATRSRTSATRSCSSPLARAGPRCRSSRGLTGLGRRFTPVGYVDQVAQEVRLRSAASAPDAVDRFLAIRVVTVALDPGAVHPRASSC